MSLKFNARTNTLTSDDTITLALAGDGQFIFVPTGDIDFDSVENLSNGDGADGATSFTEQSNNAASATFVGNSQLDTAEFKFGTASFLFDGTGDYVTYPDIPGYALGSGDFTIEGWVRFNSLPAIGDEMTFVSQFSTSTASDRSFAVQLIQDGSSFRIRFSEQNIVFEQGTISAPALNTWIHFAAQRSAGDRLDIWFDGMLEFGAGGIFFGAIDNSTETLKLGVLDPGDGGGNEGFLDGWLDDVRLTVGVARYTPNVDLTPPIVAFPLNCVGHFTGENVGAGKVLNEVASFTNPTLAPRNDDDDTGIGGDGSDTIAVIAGGIEAVRYSEATGIIVTPQSDVGLTADVGSAQGNGVILSTYNIYSTVANAGDAATLPSTFPVGTQIYVKNDGANSMDVFPASGDDAGAGTNTAVAVAAGESAEFIGTVANDTWTKLINPISSSGDINITATPDSNITLSTSGATSGDIILQAVGTDGDIQLSASDDIFITATGSLFLNATTISATDGLQVDGVTSTGNVSGSFANISNATTLLSGLTGASATAASLIPDGALIVGVTVRVTTTITGATSFDIGDGTDVDRWGVTIGLPSGTTTTGADFTSGTVEILLAAGDVVLTANGPDFSAGAVRIVAYYMDLTAPTS